MSSDLLDLLQTISIVLLGLALIVHQITHLIRDKDR